MFEKKLSVCTERDLRRAFSRENLVTKFSLECDTDTRLIDNIDIDECLKNNNPRYISIYISDNIEEVGISCCRFDSRREVMVNKGEKVEKIVEKSTWHGTIKAREKVLVGNRVERQNFYKTEWSMLLVPGKQGNIPLKIIKRFILDMQEVGLRIRDVTFDGFKPGIFVKRFSIPGVSTNLLLLKETSLPYGFLATAISGSFYKSIREVSLIKTLKYIKTGGSSTTLNSICCGLWRAKLETERDLRTYHKVKQEWFNKRNLQ